MEEWTEDCEGWRVGRGASNNVFTHEMDITLMNSATITGCARQAEDWTCQDSIMDRGRDPETGPLLEGLLIIVVSGSGHGIWVSFSSDN